MKFLLDSCISSFAVEDLKDSGFDVLWIPEIGKDPGDEAIIKKAFDEGWVLVTHTQRCQACKRAFGSSIRSKKLFEIDVLLNHDFLTFVMSS